MPQLAPARNEILDDTCGRPVQVVPRSEVTGSHPLAQGEVALDREIAPGASGFGEHCPGGRRGQGGPTREREELAGAAVRGGRGSGG